MKFPLLLAGGIACFALVSFALYFRRAYAFKLKTLADRADLSGERIYEMYFATSGLPEKLVIAAWNELADFLELPRGKLRPHDSLYEDLAPPKGFEYDDPTLMIPELMRQKLKQAGQPLSLLDCEKVKCVSDYVLFVSRISVGRERRGSPTIGDETR